MKANKRAIEALTVLPAHLYEQVTVISEHDGESRVGKLIRNGNNWAIKINDVEFQYFPANMVRIVQNNPLIIKLLNLEKPYKNFKKALA